MFGICFAGLILAAGALGCNPAVPTVCQAYARADVAFVGTLLAIEKVPGPYLQIDARFSVDKVYKGTASKTELIRFGSGDCDPQITKVGQRYFVYKEPYHRRVANLTNEYYLESRDVQYAESVLRRSVPEYSISGWFVSLTLDELQKVMITINDESRNITQMRPDSSGRFQFRTTTMGRYTMTIDVGVDGKRTQVESLGGFREYYGRSVKFDFNASPSECDNLEITF